MKKLLITLLCCLVLAGCGKKENNNSQDKGSEINSEEVNKKEWTYEDLEKEFGGIIETDCISVRDCLNELSWKDYYISGYITDLSGNILTITDELENETSYKITVAKDTSTQYIPEIGDMVYMKVQNIDSFDDNYYLSDETTNLDDGYVLKDKTDDNYLSVKAFIDLEDKIYKDTYFKTEGIIMQDGEDINGNPEYYLYPSEQSYKEDKYSRIEVSFRNNYSDLNGKHIVIMGNPDKNAISQALKNCNIVGGDKVEEIEKETDNEEEEKTESNILIQKEYKVDGKEVSISLIETDGKYKIDISGHAKNEEKASIMLATFTSQLKKVNNIDGFNISIFCGNLSAIYMTTDDGYYIVGTNKDGTYAFSAPDWIVTDFIMSEEKLEAYSGKIIKVLNKFAEDMENKVSS